MNWNWIHPLPFWTYKRLDLNLSEWHRHLAQGPHTLAIAALVLVVLLVLYTFLLCLQLRYSRGAGLRRRRNQLASFGSEEMLVVYESSLVALKPAAIVPSSASFLFHPLPLRFHSYELLLLLLLFLHARFFFN